jgi:hypothetical protein
MFLNDKQLINTRASIQYMTLGRTNPIVTEVGGSLTFDISNQHPRFQQVCDMLGKFDDRSPTVDELIDALKLLR